MNSRSLFAVVGLPLLSACAVDVDDGDASDDAIISGPDASALEDVDCKTFEPIISAKQDVAALEPVRCAYITLPESRAKKSGKVKLPVLVAKATGAGAANAPPLVMLNGGPGGSSVAFLGGAAPSANGKDFAAIRKARDLVLVNERGVAFSKPHLTCTELDALVPPMFGADGKIHPIADAAKLAAVSACHDRWTKAGVDLASYNLFEMTADVHDTLKALGYAKYSIYGVSFGSMFTQQVAKRFPDDIASLVLDSPVAVDGNLIVDVTGAGGSSDRALRALLDGCAADATCAQRFPNLRAALTKEVADLNAVPEAIPVADPNGGSRTFSAALTGDLFVGTIIANMTQGPEGLASYPKLIDGLRSDNPARPTFIGVAQQALANKVVPGKDDNHAMNLSVVCSGWGFASPSALSDGGDPLLTGIVAVGQAQLAECTRWPVPRLASVWPDANAPLASSKIPVLLMPAKFDANTPPAMATRIASHLKTAYVHTWADRGHAHADFACAGPIIAAFLADPTRDPDASCMESLSVHWVE